ncbi:hypothetical protein XM38_004740 [Halomicronema hongdechloris C2206]|uniref:VOC domain-containing protein n=1 Tax=Halomicronema hongdechloris C2206 TaxID=1641165 RepID=A0A1Z3HH64_9CYAN|nr:VOC family protein [Halomicronema hongdechloris]ASC69547.1 hypothetical protein XM38_004740 [Halomicronema hongdechloris C2206]
MSTTDKTAMGQVVWHDLLTNDVEQAKHFYATLLGWEYQIEHAAHFAWTSGEADYPLIIANGAAQGGFVDPGRNISSRWLAFVRVEDVDTTVARAEALGATIDWHPFDVPGVGRNAVSRIWSDESRSIRGASGSQEYLE